MERWKRSTFRLIFAFYIFSVLVMLLKLHEVDLWTSKPRLTTLAPAVHLDNVLNVTEAKDFEDQHVKNETDHDNNVIVNHIYRYGPGKNGHKLKVPSDLQESIKKYVDPNHGFNTLLSDVIGYHRHWDNCGLLKCENKTYPSVLPTASVIIIFRDELASIVLRTAYSVLENSNGLVEEVILVDDGSINEELKMLVGVHVANEPNLKLIVNEAPLGLMMARQRGIEASVSDYFVVMDGHMEVCNGWLEPLLARLLEEPKALVSPCVGAIAADTFEMVGCQYYDQVVMYFSPLTLNQAWVPYKKDYIEKRKDSTAPLEFAVAQGMILAMRKDFFMQLGGFDPGMKIWGTEQMEIAVKVWMCGGRVEMLPCSRVVHMFRSTPWLRNINGSHHVNNNRARFAAVWLDGIQREVVLTYQLFDGGIMTDVSDRVRIREDNHCKPYSYFLEQVSRFIDVFSLDNVKAMGPIRNAFFNKCLDLLAVNASDTIGSYMCMENNSRQFFLWTSTNQIRLTDYIFIVKANSTVINVEKNAIMHYDPGTYFNYTPENTLFHQHTGLCVTSYPDTTDVGLATCNGGPEQIWEWERR